MAQTFTSAGTSINSNRIPAVFRKAHFSAPIVFDYGSGKYTDHIEKYIRSKLITYLPYDPYNQDDHINKVSMKMVEHAIDARLPVDVVCSNVLNVIDDDDTVRKVAGHIVEIVNATGGTAFITVYEGDRSGHGRQTGRDQYQRNEPLRNYLHLFPSNAVIRNGMIIVIGR